MARETDAARELVEEIGARGASASPFGADLRDPDARWRSSTSVAVGPLAIPS